MKRVALSTVVLTALLTGCAITPLPQGQPRQAPVVVYQQQGALPPPPPPPTYYYVQPPVYYYVPPVVIYPWVCWFACGRHHHR